MLKDGLKFRYRFAAAPGDDDIRTLKKVAGGWLLMRDDGTCVGTGNPWNDARAVQRLYADGDYELLSPAPPRSDIILMPGGSPIFPSADDAIRSQCPVVTGCMDYFPLALLEIARFSLWANDKHNPGEPLHWSRGKSFDHANKIGRHLLERGTPDPNTGGKFTHTVGLSWRSLALLQKELELARGYDRDAGAK